MSCPGPRGETRGDDELQHTDDREEAVGIAVGTAGSAVVFAGLTVIIALAALLVVGIPFLASMGLAAAATVFIAVLVALTLLPALLGMTKSKAFGGRVRRYRPKRDENGLILNNGVRWARVIARAPVAVVLVVIVGLGALALPLQSLHLAFPSDSTASVDTTQRKASDLVAEAFGPGRDAPMLTVVDARDVPEADRGAAYDEVVAWAAGQDGVANAQLVGTNEQGTGASVLITPATGPEDTATEDLLTDLRDGQADIEEATGTTTGVTGLTAITTDVSERLSGALPIYLSIVVGLAFMISVFAAFILIDEPIIKSMGFALAVAVFFDAFIVRMTLVPALMYLLGEKAWWLPAWLDRLLPNVDVEGERLVRPHLSGRSLEDELDKLDEESAVRA